eukprot:Nk52_evm26s914 gene=Nk52_evmTU26s914
MHVVGVLGSRRIPVGVMKAASTLAGNRGMKLIFDGSEDVNGFSNVIYIGNAEGCSDVEVNKAVLSRKDVNLVTVSPKVTALDKYAACNIRQESVTQGISMAIQSMHSIIETMPTKARAAPRDNSRINFTIWRTNREQPKLEKNAWDFSKLLRCVSNTSVHKKGYTESNQEGMKKKKGSEVEAESAYVNPAFDGPRKKWTVLDDIAAQVWNATKVEQHGAYSEGKNDPPEANGGEIGRSHMDDAAGTGWWKLIDSTAAEVLSSTSRDNGELASSREVRNTKSGNVNLNIPAPCDPTTEDNSEELNLFEEGFFKGCYKTSQDTCGGISGNEESGIKGNLPSGILGNSVSTMAAGAVSDLETEASNEPIEKIEADDNKTYSDLFTMKMAHGMEQAVVNTASDGEKVQEKISASSANPQLFLDFISESPDSISCDNPTPASVSVRTHQARSTKATNSDLMWPVAGEGDETKEDGRLVVGRNASQKFDRDVEMGPVNPQRPVVDPFMAPHVVKETPLTGNELASKTQSSDKGSNITDRAAEPDAIQQIM